MITSSTSRGIDARALDGVAHDVAAEGGAVGHVEGAAPGLGEAGAGGGDDDGVSHVLTLTASPRGEGVIIR